MRKIWTALLAVILAVPLVLQTSAQAAPAISVYIDGAKLATDQAPVMVQGRVMLPLRAIFEALGASVNWNQSTKTVTASKDGTTIVLTLKAKTAKINNVSIGLDVPAQSIKGRTMIPVRFVSEALGQEVGWNSKSQIVTITSGKNAEPDTLIPVSYVTLRDVANNGDGRDLEVSFSRSSTESLVDHYRILIVKAANASGFNLATAAKVTSANYTTVSPKGTDPSIRLSSGSRDVDGAAIKTNQPYVGFVLAVGKGNVGSSLSNPSSQITLDPGASVAAATNVKATDISDYGDGRDLSVSFTRAQNEGNISNYRVFIVKTKDAGSFNLSAANDNQYYTNVNKSGSGSTLTGTLSSSSRDTAGDLIRNNVSYTAFVLSVSNNATTASNKLSSASSSLVLGEAPVAAPVITRVDDILDHGDGRDLKVSFTKSSTESRISGYRVFVVKSGDASSFNLAKANAVSSANYTEIKKDGYNKAEPLFSSSRDVDGDLIRNGVTYRVFVMAVGSGSNAGSNALSSASSSITLLNNYGVGLVTNLKISDVNDNGDGRDLQVSYTRASDESNISEYRIMIVKSSKAGSFTVSKAEGVHWTNYTRANTGSNFNNVLSSDARDTDGDLIQNGVSYRAFVLTVGKGAYSGEYKLTSQSSALTLTNNYSVGEVSGLVVKDVNDNGNGSDLQVTFNRASDETNINHYRIFVVKSENAGSFNLSKADRSDYFAKVNKAGNTLSQVLPNGARDVDGDPIRNDVKYKVFVLSVANSNYGGSNAISKASAEIRLTDSSAVAAVSGLAVTAEGNTGSAEDIKVSFTKPANQDNIAEYRILVVPSDKADGFGVNQANRVTIRENFTPVETGGSRTVKLSVQSPNDAYGNAITTNATYQVFVLTVAKSGAANVLSGASDQVKIKPNPADSTSVPAVTLANIALDDSGISVKFTQPDKSEYIADYEVFAVPAGAKVDLETAVKLYNEHKTTDAEKAINTDIDGRALDAKAEYEVYILSVPNMKNAKVFGLSKPFKVDVNK